MRVTRKLVKQLNKIAFKYNGFRAPKELQNLWTELEAVGVEVGMINRSDEAVGGWRGRATWTYKGEEVDNSWFVIFVYEDTNGPWNDYNIYFS